MAPHHMELVGLLQACRGLPEHSVIHHWHVEGCRPREHQSPAELRCV